jgi:hypothetical protein
VKWVKLAVAILLLPLCVGALPTLWRVVQSSGKADTIWVALLAGAACWVTIFLLLPKPMLVYVFGHELTHALWTWSMGGKVKKFKASSKGGHVIITKTNFLIGLAPYFFPLYAVLVVLGFLIGHLIWDWHRYQAIFHLLLGAAYAFHVTLTAHVLQSRQTDITEQGYVFSAVVIWLGNIAVLVFGIPLLTSATSLLTAAGWWLQDTGRILSHLGSLF